MSTSSTRDWLSALADESLGDFTLSVIIDASLSQQALLARDDPAARDALFRSLAFKINRFSSRFRRWNLRPWGIDDVHQEAYLAFVDVLGSWRPLPSADGPAGFGFYFMRVFPLRLTDRVRRLVRTKRDRPLPTAWNEADDRRLHPDAMEDDIETLAFIIDLSSRLDPADAQIMVMRTLDDLAPDEIAARAGISRRTLYRRWNRIAATIRRETG